MRCYSPDGHPRFRPLRRQIAPGPTDVVDRFWPSINTLGRKHGYVFRSVGMGSRRWPKYDDTCAKESVSGAVVNEITFRTPIIPSISRCREATKKQFVRVPPLREYKSVSRAGRATSWKKKYERGERVVYVWIVRYNDCAPGRTFFRFQSIQRYNRVLSDIIYNSSFVIRRFGK